MIIIIENYIYIYEQFSLYKIYTIDYYIYTNKNYKSFDKYNLKYIFSDNILKIQILILNNIKYMKI